MNLNFDMIILHHPATLTSNSMLCPLPLQVGRACASIALRNRCFMPYFDNSLLRIGLPELLTLDL